MKIWIANTSRQSLGGGWSFIHNLKKALGDKVEFVDSWEDCDIVFIAGATMIDRDTIKQAKAKGKKLVLRIDNIPKNSRNRNTGTSRLKDYSDWADAVIYQSEWAKKYVGYFLDKDGIVIHNGVDTEIFNFNKEKANNDKALLYIRYNRDESKRPQEAFMLYHYFWRKHRDSELWILGVFSDNSREYNFDFFMDENVTYFAPMPLERMASYYQESSICLCPFWMDACSNVVLESQACGTPVMYSHSGGTPEITSRLFDAPISNNMNRNIKSMDELLKVDRQMLADWTRDNFNLSIMGNKYMKVFNGL